MRKNKKNLLDEVQLNLIPLNQDAEGKLLGGFTELNAEAEAEWNVFCSNDCDSNDCVNVFCRNSSCGQTTTETTTETTILPDIPIVI